MTVSPLEALAAVSLSILHIAVRIAGISDDPRYAAFAKEWGVASPPMPTNRINAPRTS